MGKSYLLIIFIAIANSYSWKLRLPRDILHSNHIQVREKVAPNTANGPAQPKVAVAAAAETPKVANVVDTNSLEPRIIPGRLPEDVGPPKATRRHNNPLMPQRTEESKGMLSGLLETGRRNLDTLKAIPVLGSAVSQLVRKKRSIKNTDVHVPDLTDLFNRTNDLVQVLNDEYNSLALSEKDSHDPVKYAESVLRYFNLQLFRNYYSSNSNNLADVIEKSINEMNNVRNFTAVQFAAPAVRSVEVFRSIISLPMEIVRTSCTSDTPNEKCVFNYVRMLTSLNQNDPCNSSRLSKGRIFETVLKVFFNSGTSAFTKQFSEIKNNVMAKANAEKSEVRRKRAIAPSLNVANLKETQEDQKIVKTRSVTADQDDPKIIKINTNILPIVPNNVPSGNPVQSQPIVPNNVPFVQSQPQTNAPVAVKPSNIVANIADNVPVLANNAKLANGPGTVVPSKAVNSAQGVNAVTKNIIQPNALSNQASLVNPGQIVAAISPSRRSNDIDTSLELLFDFILSELKKLSNPEMVLDGRYEIHKAIADTQNSGISLCSTLNADRILDDPDFLGHNQ